MSIPINEVDLTRLQSLAMAIRDNKDLTSKQSKGTKAELSIYCSKNNEGNYYVHIEMSGYVPVQIVDEIMNK